MPGLFQGVTLTWAGREYTVPADRQMRLIAQLEDMLRGPNGEPPISMLYLPGGPGYARLSAAWAAALRYAGADVTDEAVYAHIAGAVMDRDPERMREISAAIVMLINTILPPADSPVARMAEVAGGKKTRPVRSGAGPSKGSTSGSSARAGSARKGSGG